MPYKCDLVLSIYVSFQNIFLKYLMGNKEIYKWKCLSEEGKGAVYNVVG